MFVLAFLHISEKHALKPIKTERYLLFFFSVNLNWNFEKLIRVLGKDHVFQVKCDLRQSHGVGSTKRFYTMGIDSSNFSNFEAEFYADEEILAVLEDIKKYRATAATKTGLIDKRWSFPLSYSMSEYEAAARTSGRCLDRAKEFHKNYKTLEKLGVRSLSDSFDEASMI